MKQAILGLMFVLISNNAAAMWVRIGENDRSIAYAESAIHMSGGKAVTWVLFDYKSLQKSPSSGKRYLSEKSQREINCNSEQERVLIFTWYAEQMGNGTIVYTGRKTTDWEPTSYPGSYGNAIWSFACRKK